VQRRELGAFLRAHREAADPVSHGFSPTSRRRTPGLRREEAAQLAGISVTWYTWLEQGRDITVSRQVIDSLARVHQLGPAERAHLFTLAGLALPPQPAVRPRVSAIVTRLLAALDPNPAYVINPWWDLLACNRSYQSLVGGLDRRPEAERNSLWMLFTDDRVRAMFADWQAEARPLLGQLRAHLGQYPRDPRGPELVEALTRVSRAFRDLWQPPDVRNFEIARKRLMHSVAGRLDLDYVKLAVAGDDQQQLLIFLPADDATAAALGQLAGPSARPPAP
jgi:transcriptional regulator with XRE-family HTH domain